MAAQGLPSKMKELRLPISRVKTIMKSSPYVDTVGQDGLYLVTKATVSCLWQIYGSSNDANAFEYGG